MDVEIYAAACEARKVNASNVFLTAAASMRESELKADGIALEMRE